MTLRTAFLWTLIISLAGAALLGIMVIIMPDLLPADEEILVTALLIGLYSLPALACAIVLGRGRAKPAMWTGIITAPLAWAIWLPMIWGNPWTWPGDWDDTLIKGGFTLSIITAWSAHLGMLLLLRLERPWFRMSRAGTLFVAIVLSVFSTIALWAEWDDEIVFRTLAVMTILTSAGTIITPIFALIEVLQRRSEHETVPSNLRINITCPRCQSEQEIPVGVQRCGNCNLRIELHVEEPRCTCGYLLYQLKGDRCPECGRRIADGEFWQAAETDDDDCRQTDEAGAS